MLLQFLMKDSLLTSLTIISLLSPSQVIVPIPFFTQLMLLGEYIRI